LICYYAILDYIKLNIECDAESELSRDHNPILCTIDEEVLPKGNKRMRFKVKNFNWFMLREALDEFDVKSLKVEEVELSGKVELFLEKLIEIAKTVVLYKEICHHHGCIWWNEDYSKAKREFLRKKGNI